MLVYFVTGMFIGSMMTFLLMFAYFWWSEVQDMKKPFLETDFPLYFEETKPTKRTRKYERRAKVTELPVKKDGTAKKPRLLGTKPVAHRIKQAVTKQTRLPRK